MKLLISLLWVVSVAMAVGLASPVEPSTGADIFLKILNPYKFVNMTVDLSLTVKAFKAIVEKEQGIAANKQLLVEATGSRMDDDRTLESYKIHKFSTIWLFVKRGEGAQRGTLNAGATLKVVAWPWNQTLTLANVDLDTTTVLAVKKKLFSQGAPVPEQQVLIFKDDVIGNEQTLEHYKVQDNSTIDLFYLDPGPM